VHVADDSPLPSVRCASKSDAGRQGAAADFSDDSEDSEASEDSELGHPQEVDVSLVEESVRSPAPASLALVTLTLPQRRYTPVGTQAKHAAPVALVAAA